MISGSVPQHARSRIAGMLVVLALAITSGCSGDDPPDGTATPDPGDGPAAISATPTPTPEPPVELEPGDDVQTVVDQHPAGTEYVLTAGVYREQSIVPKDGDRFRGDGEAILSGARVLDGFTQEGEYWVLDFPIRRVEPHGGCDNPEALPDIRNYRGCQVSEQLFFDDERLWPMTALDRLAPGRWFFDYDAGRIYLVDDPSDHLVELSTTQKGFSGPASGVTIEGLVVEKYASPAQSGAIDGREGDSWTVVDNEIRLNHAHGLRIGRQMTVRGNAVVHNGQLGIGGIGDGALIEDNEVAYNNESSFDREWEAGGIKVVLSDDVVMRGNRVHHNDGRGLWTDIEVANLLVEDNVVEWNSFAGIVHEISYSARIVNNVSNNNGLGFDVWVWGAQILVQNSSQVVVSGNDVTVSSSGGDGIAVINQNRVSDTGTVYESREVTISDNTIRHLGLTGTDGSPDACAAELANRFDGNRYEAPAEWFEQQHFEWCALLNWAGFQEIGQEPSGVATEITPSAGG
jgi:hypothetical protein